jgi:predicted glycogen debranching enzyme
VTIRIEAAECRDVEQAIQREWLVTNGLGGYASGTLAGVNTRRYHGLLMAALRPPVLRVLLLAGLEDWFQPDDEPAQPLFAEQRPDGTIAPLGFSGLESFRLDGLLPVFRWRIGAGTILERRVWMEPGHDRTVISYRILGCGMGTLRLRPLFAHRLADLHRHARTTACALARTEKAGWRIQVDGLTSTVATEPPGRLIQAPRWHGPVRHQAERDRGLDHCEDLYAPGTIEVPLKAGRPVCVIASIDALPAGWSAAASLNAARSVQLAAHRGLDPVNRGRPLDRQLALAAGQFRVRRQAAPPRVAPDRTIIAGYPWFADWGRDTMIALRGVALATGCYAEARAILRTFIASLDGGMLPNAFHDPGQPTEYNTIDATLWLFQALAYYLQVTEDWPFVEAQLDALQEVIRWHVAGTRYGIRMDPRDGLLAGGAPGYGLTWMDAKDGDWVVTPRRGKPIEIAALWYNALYLQATWSMRAGREPEPFLGLAQRARASAQRRYWYQPGRYLFDVIDGPDGDDASLRPNQLMALGLTYPLIDGAYARSALEVVTAKLLTPYGLRTLSPDDPRYQSRFAGDHRSRDAAYQMGLVWPWLLGPYLDAHRRVHGDSSIAQQILAPFQAHLREAGLGTVSEIFEAEPPYRPVGAIAQAWSVGELLWQARRSAFPTSRLT